MFLILNLIVIVLTYYLFIQYKKKTGLSMKLVNNTMTSIGSLRKKERNRLKERDDFADELKRNLKFFMSIPLFSVSQRTMARYEYLALRMDRTVKGNNCTGEILYYQRCLAISKYLIVMCILVLKNFNLAPLLLAYPFVGTLKETKWENEVKKKDEEIEEDFFELYSEFYFTYKFPDNIRERIDEVALRFRDRAKPATRHMIDLIRADSKVSEEYALDNLKENFKLIKIHRMCDQLKLIILGRNIGTDGLIAFKEELDEERKFKRKEEKDKKIEGIMVIFAVPFFMTISSVVLWLVSAVMEMFTVTK